MSARHASSINKSRAIVGHTYIDKPATVDELAAYFGVHKRTVEYWVKNQLIPLIRINRTVRFNIAEIERAFSVKGRGK
jgi:excisionase family DNA binding protein